jgi:uncharacterized damage-inducible protein DinB
MKKNLGMLARYNEWANGRLYKAAARLSGDQLSCDMGAFFGSLLGTLNHLLVGDMIWMSRFEGRNNEIRDLNAVLYDDLSSLWEARQLLDRQIVAYIDRLDRNTLDGTIKYKSNRNPADIEQYLAPLLLHFFNHQTHHRGQAHCILTALVGEAPSLDLFIYQRESGDSILSGAGNVSLVPEKRSTLRAKPTKAPPDMPLSGDACSSRLK